jgi:D-serine deaminase-like pyridoxal phosphate-dependent protein
MLRPRRREIDVQRRPSWVCEADNLQVDWRLKSFGAAHAGRTIAELVHAEAEASALPTPVLTLDATAVEHNIEIMRGFTKAHSVDLAPHGKTTMSPALWHRQIAAGAWAITVATPWQLRVAYSVGIKRILHAGAVLSAAELASIGELRSQDQELDVLVWADSARSVEQMSAGYPDDAPPLQILAERGAPGARTGARSVEELVATARAVDSASNLRLRGVTAWEGSLDGARGPGGADLVGEFCDGIAEGYEAIVDAGLLDGSFDPVISAGGSSFFHVVVDRWADRLAGASVRPRIVLRSGCYLTHDDGLYRNSSPFGVQSSGPQLRAALHLWARVVSRPEPGLALLDAGRRDAPYDGLLPVPQLVRGRDAASSEAALAGAQITQLNDQHAYLRLVTTSDLGLGEVVRCGISHPCTAFDKWKVVPVVDDARGSAARLIGAVQTIF